jgi:hypothetical protein
MNRRLTMPSTTAPTNIHRRALPRSIQIVFVGLVLGLAVPHHVIRTPAQPESTKIFGYFDFKFKSKDLKNLSRPWRYTWHNSGTIASVEHNCRFSSGKAKLVVHDGAGQQVYSRALDEQGTFFTNPGVAGEWTIEVVVESDSH